MLAAGRDPATPVLVVARGTTPEQASWRGDLADLASAADPEAIGGPALLVVGPVAALALRSYESRPLSGWRVVVTRAAHQAAPLSAALSARGARPLELPVIAVEPPRDGGAALAAAAGRLAGYDWVVFTSANAVERLLALVHDARDFAGAKLAAIGSATGEALAAQGLVADLVPGRFVAEELLSAFPPPPSGREGRVLLPRAAEAREVLPEGLRRCGWLVDVVEAYRTVPVAPTPERRELLRSADAVTVTSSSTARAVIELAGVDGLPPVVASIGPVTTATCTEAGVEVTVEAETSTVEGLAAALAGYARRHGRPAAGAPHPAGVEEQRAGAPRR
jgi:uroporphyrinogen III methyltransferase/synthase